MLLNSWHGLTLVRKCTLLCSVLAILFFAAAIPLFRSGQANQNRAEAKIVLGYLAALQAAYFTDNGRYAHFKEAYGATTGGRENCRLPEGAKELGFKLRGCQRPAGKGGYFYIYRVLPGADPKSGFLAEAISGTDINGDSILCSDPKLFDKWQIGPDRIPVHVESCS